jgi:Ribosomal L28e protein family
LDADFVFLVADLTWLLVRQNNSRVVRRPGTGLRPLSTEHGNVRNLHSQRDSGFAMDKVRVVVPAKREWTLSY